MVTGMCGLRYVVVLYIVGITTIVYIIVIRVINHNTFFLLTTFFSTFVFYFCFV